MFKEKPLIDELTDYIIKNLKKGYTQDSLKWALINQGYSRMEVERAFKKSNHQLATKAPILKTKPKIKYELVEPTKPKNKFF
jgi:hypothetical protein